MIAVDVEDVPDPRFGRSVSTGNDSGFGKQSFWMLRLKVGNRGGRSQTPRLRFACLSTGGRQTPKRLITIFPPTTVTERRIKIQAAMPFRPLRIL
jgi:hypothetical protein